MSAWGSFATPWMTLTRSKTTRRSAPSTRSRLRRPTSKSTTTTLSPECASAGPGGAAEVVWPTAPLPDVTTTTRGDFLLSIFTTFLLLVHRRNLQCIAVEPGLNRPVMHAVLDFVSSLVMGANGQQFGLEAVAKDTSPPVPLAPR